MADWSKLSIDISSLIHGELSVLDYIRVGAVCKQWNFACKLKYHCPTKKPQSPWLVLPDECDTTTIKFFSILEKKTYKIPCPEPMIHRRAYIGSGHGWLVTVNDTCSMHLLNPLTGAQIPLPPITILSFIEAIQSSHAHSSIKFIMGQQVVSSFESLHHFFFHKAILSSTPDADGDFTIMMICNVRCQLAFAPARDKAWTSVSTHYGDADVMYHNAKFCMINYDGIIKIR
ncbi:F-box and DUF domain containing protein [Musa troglodytarum]|uniref:F-box and DUF domain containing protein n=1 Tax=Musa troglodytarum TaxID=320322 RepID=A0A9E7GS08_9LILI|nr:F-box and DUF domain containing protein [Musa troglodytarum]